jgi:hypothetical protein
VTKLEEFVKAEPEDRPVKALFDHCTNVYKEMKEQARESHDYPEYAGQLVYVGHLTKLFQALDLAVPYYTSVMKQLKAMGCVEQIRRGGGGAPSAWAMNFEPEREAFESAAPLKRPVAGKMAALEQQLRDMNGRVLKLEQMMGV